MKELLEHIKRVAIEDFKEFFEPFVWVGRAICRAVARANYKAKQWFSSGRKDDE